MSKRNLPTLQDVAKAARVSTATASRCLNAPDKVSEATRERVLRAVKHLRYAPNFGARAIAANRTNTYGAIIPTMENAIFARGIEAFQKALVAKSATMLVASSSYDPDREEEQIRTMIARGADGLLLIGMDRDPDIYALLSERNIPFIVAWAYSGDKARPCVGFDNRAAARALAERALSLGHRTFGFLSGWTRCNDRARERIEGARDALAGAGLDPDLMPVIETDYAIGSGREAFRRLLQEPVRPSVVMCGNDVLAVGAVQGAQEAGFCIPGDISITGFDDIELATVVSPALTTVHVPHRDMGRLAAEVLMGMANDDAGPRQIELATHIVERASLGIAKRL